MSVSGVNKSVRALQPLLHSSGCGKGVWPGGAESEVCGSGHNLSAAWGAQTASSSKHLQVLHTIWKAHSSNAVVTGWG